ncbi:MAG: polysaccharide biosynthesis protein [Peptostreptococcaceae bacterium]|nr:polysaccharide biosynthesis protein [Peptostreptococcaceae bacterium]
MKILKRIQLKEELLFPIFDILLNGLNYFFQIFISWYLIPIEYGSINSLLSFLAILLVLGISIQTYTAKNISTIDDFTNFFREIFKISFFMNLFIILFIFLFSKNIMNFTHSTIIHIVLLSLIFCTNIFLSLFRGLFQGNKEFLNLNKSFYIEVLSKTLFIIIFIRIYPNKSTVLLSVLIGMLLSLLFSIVKYKSFLKLAFNDFKFLKYHYMKNHFFNNLLKPTKYLIYIVLSNFFLYYFTSIDMIFANYYLPSQSGIYAVVIRYSQIIFFVSFSIITVFIPHLSSSFKVKRYFKSLFFKCFLVIISINSILLLFYKFLFPITVELIFSKEYIEASSYLFKSALSYFLLTNSFFFINVLISINENKYIYLLFITATILTYSYYNFGNNISKIIDIGIISYGLLLLSLIIYIIPILLKKEEL